MQSLFVNQEFIITVVLLLCVNFAVVFSASMLLIVPLRKKDSVTKEVFDSAAGRASFIGVLPFVLFWIIVMPAIFGADLSLGTISLMYYPHWIDIFIGIICTFVISHIAITHFQKGITIQTDDSPHT